MDRSRHVEIIPIKSTVTAKEGAFPMFLDWITFGDTLTIYQMLLRIVLSVTVGAIIGIDREIKSRPAGMRTHVLVCLGATLIGLV